MAFHGATFLREAADHHPPILPCVGLAGSRSGTGSPGAFPRIGNRHCCPTEARAVRHGGGRRGAGPHLQGG
eukprot:4556145-Pyramimonas_sp.AAC.1